VTEVDEEFRVKMREKYRATLALDVDDHIAQALGHKAMQNYPDLQAYVNGWLLRESKKLSASGPPRGQRQGATRVDFNRRSHEDYPDKFDGPLPDRR
jgi:hypothetical protein